jgi:hypothetical protein
LKAHKMGRGGGGTIGAKKIDAKIKKTANIEKAVTFFLEEIEQQFKQI